ncbi:MAG: TolC family protein [Sulfurimonas sp.]|nr:TolC family protein [Sulfurimonas sp.]
MSRFIFFYLFLLLSLSEARLLTLDECIDKSLKNHPDIKKASLEILRSTEATKEAKSAYLPQINATAQYAPVNTFVLPQNGTFNTLEDTFWQTSASLNQKIYDFGKTASIIEAYEKAAQKDAFNLEDAKALLIYKVKSYYNLALLQQHTLKSRQMDLQTKEELYKQALAFVKEGVKTEADSASFESSYYIALEELENTKAEFQKAFSSLLLYMGEKVQDGAVAELSDTEQNILSRDETLDQAISQNLSLKALESEVRSMELSYEASKSAHYGSLDAYAAYSYQNSLNEYDTTQAGITLTIPLYTGGALSAKSEQSRIIKESAKSSYDAKKLALEEQTQNLLLDLKKYEAAAKSKKATINASLVAKNIVDARYKEGLATYIEVLDANTKYLNAKMSLEFNDFNIQDTRNQLDYIQGRSE